MALGDISAGWMADQLGVSRQTLSRWMNDVGAEPRRAYLQQWAALTDTDPTWLEKGDAPDTDGGGPGGGEVIPMTRKRTRRDSNPKPSDPKVRGSVIWGPWDVDEPLRRAS